MSYLQFSAQQQQPPVVTQSAPLYYQETPQQQQQQQQSSFYPIAQSAPAYYYGGGGGGGGSGEQQQPMMPDYSQQAPLIQPQQQSTFAQPSAAKEKSETQIAQILLVIAFLSGLVGLLFFPAFLVSLAVCIAVLIKFKGTPYAFPRKSIKIAWIFIILQILAKLIWVVLALGFFVITIVGGIIGGTKVH